MALYAKNYPRFPGPKMERDNLGRVKPESYDNSLYKRNHQYNKNQPYQPYIFKPNFLKNIPKDAEGNEVQGQDNKKYGRRTIDFCTPSMKYCTRRKYQQFTNRGLNSYVNIGPGGGTKKHSDTLYSTSQMPVHANKNNTAGIVATRFVRTATNKKKCQILKVIWTPDGKRLITGSNQGEFTLWNGTTFNFETIMQAHETNIRSMCWSRNGQWLLSGDNSGFLKYWQNNMNNVNMFQAHSNCSVRGITFCPDDSKFATCADDHTIEIWDFATQTQGRKESRITLRGHGSEVKVVQWHPIKALLASGSKDLQSPVKLWCPKTEKAISTLHCHKGTVMDLKWNKNGNWFATASRDHLVKVFDIRNLKEELQIFRGHKNEAASLAWHPQHECSLTSGGGDGSIHYWAVGEENELAHIDKAHFNQDNRTSAIIWSMEWHPLGHLLCTGSQDNTARFWTRNKPGDDIDETGANREVGDAMDQYDSEANKYVPFKHNTGYIPGGQTMNPGNRPTEAVRKTVAERIYSFLARDDIIPGLEDVNDAPTNNNGYETTSSGMKKILTLQDVNNPKPSKIMRLDHDQMDTDW